MNKNLNIDAKAISQMWGKYTATTVVEASFLNLVVPRLLDIFDFNEEADNATLVLKKKIFYRLKTLREYISAKVLQEQCQKSLKSLSQQIQGSLEMAEIQELFNDTGSYLSM